MHYRKLVLLPTFLARTSSSYKKPIFYKSERKNSKTPLNIRLSYTETQISDVAMASLKGKIDRHNGITVNLGDLPVNTSEQNFQMLLKDSLKHWEENGTTCVWLYVPIMQSGLIAVAAECGFTFHHAEHSVSMLYKWLDKSREDKVPSFATHQMGAAGVVMSEHGDLLMVQDKHAKKPMWKFPGGICELGEDIGETAEREVYEETGVKSEFQSVLAFRQQHDHPGAFGRSDIYVVCRMKPLTFDISPCPDEILRCEWKSLEEAFRLENVGAITQHVLHVVKLGFEKGWDRVDMAKHKVKPVRSVPKDPFLFCRPVHIKEEGS